MAISRRLRFEILRRDGHTCRYCGAMAPDVSLTVDHVIPSTLGGTDDPANLVAACVDCNNGKASVPADAALVADVAADAIRWKRAIDEARTEFEMERQVTAEWAERFRAMWDDWTYGVDVIVPADPLDTGRPLLDRWHEVMGWRSHHYAEPVSAEDGVLTIKAQKGYVREIRSEATASLPKWAAVLGQPLESVVIEPVNAVAAPPRPPEPTKRTERQRIPRDSNWHDSVVRFLSLGLTMDDLKRLMGIAMTNSRLNHDDRFRYFCGCAWREITDLQESARRIIEEEDADGRP